MESVSGLLGQFVGAASNVAKEKLQDMICKDVKPKDESGGNDTSDKASGESSKETGAKIMKDAFGKVKKKNEDAAKKNEDAAKKNEDAANSATN